MILNSDIPFFKALVKRSYFTKNPEDKEFDNVYVFALQSVGGKMLTFHVMTDYGMLRSRVPISEIYLFPPTQDISPHFKQLWDCFSETHSVTTYDFLKEHKCQVILRDKSKVWAKYMFTIDWYNNPFSNEPSDYKCGHILCSDTGYLLCMPNNRIFWKDSNWITKPFPVNPKEILVDTHLPSVENHSDKWISEDTNSFYYDINQSPEPPESQKPEEPPYTEYSENPF
jgi:hypothetical protein